MVDYKKIVRSKSMRLALLKALNWVPDIIMVKFQYWLKFGFFPNLKSPKRYSEKMQVYKLKYRNPIMSRCVDKYEVRSYLQEKGLDKYLVSLYGVYDCIDDVVFENLPDKFVIKSTTGSGGMNVIIVEDKVKCNWLDICKKVSSWHIHCPGDVDLGREWAYTNMPKTRILVEKLLESTEDHGLIDYKFICFNGRAEYLYVMSDRFFGKDAALAIYDRDFNKTNYYEIGERKSMEILPKPKNFEIMLEVADELSKEFPQVRVDLYNIDGDIFFGELTFYDESGYTRFDPDSFDFKLGGLFDICSLM